MARPLKVGVQLPEVEYEYTWPQLAEMARVAEDVGLDSIWLGDHLMYRYQRKRAGAARPVRGLDYPRRAGCGHEPGRARPAGRQPRIPQPGHDRQEGRDDRPDQQRPLHPRHRLRLARAGVQGLRLPVRSSGQSLRRGIYDPPRAARDRRVRLPGEYYTIEGGLLFPKPVRARRDPDHARLARTTHARDRAAVRRDVERVVRGLGQQPDRPRPPSGRDRRRLREGRPRSADP